MQALRRKDRAARQIVKRIARQMAALFDLVKRQLEMGSIDIQLLIEKYKLLQF
ncbi:MAG: hypothetical protein J0I98_16670 [Mesorhizobium sp.]|nr:hypothetical protein [Mesorhizobium sp.]MBN9244421.1 hypothetical protein [Mesorhizobium sp.]